jgi:Tfp pilus assembly protein PilW
MKLNNTKGMSLVEMMVAVGIFVFLSVGMLSVVYVGNQAWSMQDANVYVQTQVRLTVSKLARDLRVASGLAIAQDADNVNVSFTKGASAITYAWTTDEGSTQHQLIRSVDGNAIVVAQDITAFSITESADDIQVNLTAEIDKQGHTLDYSLISNVAKR